MLSIVICHRNPVLLTAIKKNIEATIGIPYELIIIDNTKNEHSIFSAYNEGVKRSKYDIVCFTHEDILFYSDDWGKKVLAHFNNPETGMIGLIGGLAQSVVPSAWWFNNYFDRSARNLLMRSTDKKDKKLYHYYSNPFNDVDKTEAVIIDGLWFCIKKDLFKKIAFDEKYFSGFHLYDADISMQALQHKKNYVVYDILIEHFWTGNISEDYYMELRKFVTKWKDYLPLHSEKVKNDYLNIYNWHALRSVILEMKTKDIPEKYLKDIYNDYYPLIKQNFNSIWFKSYFFISRLIGYRITNSIFYRVEKLSGLSKAPGYIKKEYKTSY